MKQNITIEDLKQLSASQKDTLRFLWLPKKYDLVFTQICMDAENEVFDNIEFIVGDVNFGDFESNSYKGTGNISLYDIRSMNSHSETDEDANDDDDDDDSSDLAEDDLVIDDDELALELEVRPSIFGWNECLPLLSIGNMIEFLLKNHYDEKGFQVDIDEDEVSLIKNTPRYSYENSESFKSNEPCDVLWQAVLGLLV